MDALEFDQRCELTQVLVDDGTIDVNVTDLSLPVEQVRVDLLLTETNDNLNIYAERRVSEDIYVQAVPMMMMMMMIYIPLLLAVTCTMYRAYLGKMFLEHIQ